MGCHELHKLAGRKESRAESKAGSHRLHGFSRIILYSIWKIIWLSDHVSMFMLRHFIQKSSRYGDSRQTAF